MPAVPHSKAYASSLYLHMLTDANLPKPDMTKASARSISGICIMFAGGPLDSGSSRQHAISTASTTSEAMALSLGTQRLIPLIDLLRFFGLRIDQPVPTFCDNTMAALIAANNASIKRTAYALRRLLFVCEAVDEKVVKIFKVPTADNFSDVLTKSLPAPAFKRHLPYLTGRGRPLTYTPGSSYSNRE